MEHAKEKQYVQVDARWNVDGDVCPVAVIWSDGRRLDAQRMIGKPVPLSKSKRGGSAVRFDVLIRGRTRSLYFEQVPDEWGSTHPGIMRWYVEVPALPLADEDAGRTFGRG